MPSFQHPHHYPETNISPFSFLFFPFFNEFIPRFHVNWPSVLMSWTAVDIEVIEIPTEIQHTNNLIFNGDKWQLWLIRMYLAVQEPTGNASTENDDKGGKKWLLWNKFGMTSSEMNFDSRTCPRFRYHPWAFLCEVYMFSTSLCGSSVFHPQSTHMHARWTGDYTVSTRIAVFARPVDDWWCVQQCSSPFHQCTSAFWERFSALDICTRFLSRAWEFWQRFPDSFVWSFYEVFYTPALRARGQVMMKWFWVTGKPGNIFEKNKIKFGAGTVNRCCVVSEALNHFKKFFGRTAWPVGIRTQRTIINFDLSN